MNSIQKHTLLRSIVLFVGLVASIITALESLDPQRRCGTGDGLWIGIIILGFYILSSLILIIEAIVLHIKKKKKKRNTNLLLLLFIPLLLCVIGIFSAIID